MPIAPFIACWARGGAAVSPVAAAFPGVVDEGAVDRRLLGARVFGDAAALRELEGILHPLRRSRAPAISARREHGRAGGWSCSTSRCCSRPAASAAATRWSVVSAPRFPAAGTAASTAGHEPGAHRRASCAGRCRMRKSAGAPTSSSRPASASGVDLRHHPRDRREAARRARTKTGLHHNKLRSS